MRRARVGRRARWSVEGPARLTRSRRLRVHRRVRLFAPSDEVDRVRACGARARTTASSGRQPRRAGVGGSAGVYGYGDNGVVGESAGTGAGVLALASSATALALDVQGKVKFSRSGRATLGAGKSSVKVTLAGTTTRQPCLRRAAHQSNRSVGPVGRADDGLLHDLPQWNGDVVDVHRLVCDQLTCLTWMRSGADTRRPRKSLTPRRTDRRTNSEGRSGSRSTATVDAIRSHADALGRGEPIRVPRQAARRPQGLTRDPRTTRSGAARPIR